MTLIQAIETIAALAPTRTAILKHYVQRTIHKHSEPSTSEHYALSLFCEGTAEKIDLWGQFASPDQAVKVVQQFLKEQGVQP